MEIINKIYNDLSELNSRFENAKPFPHIVLDNFLDKDFFQNLDVDKINVDKNKGTNFQTHVEKNKWASKMLNYQTI